MKAAMAAQRKMVEAAMALFMDLPGHPAALMVVPIPGKRQILMMYMTTTIRMILRKNGQMLTEDRTAQPDAAQLKAVNVAAAFLAKQMEE